MRETTLCYILRGDQVLMLHRTKKKNDLNHDKWIGVGGHLEPGETPEVCVLREAMEETGLTLTAYAYRGVLRVCDEGDLQWIDRARLFDLPMWEGDRIFLNLLERGEPFFDLTLRYRGETLERAELNGRALNGKDLHP